MTLLQDTKMEFLKKYIDLCKTYDLYITRKTIGSKVQTVEYLNSDSISIFETNNDDVEFDFTENVKDWGGIMEEILLYENKEIENNYNVSED